MGLLDYIFKETFPLGNAYLPDGRTFFSDEESILWDSKGLIKGKSLRKSTKQKKSGIVKDTFYIQAFKNKKFNFKFYVYLTVGVSKEDFERVKVLIDKRLLSLDIKDVKIVCITDKWLLSLSEYFVSQDDSSRIHKNMRAFTEIIKREFDKGYLDSFDKTLLESVGKTKVLNTSEIKKEVKNLMNE